MPHRIFWLLIAVLCLAASPAKVCANLLQKNLLIQWRVNASAAQQQEVRGLSRGEVVIDTRRGVSGEVGVSWSTQDARSQSDADGQVLVLNGAQARLALTRQQPVTTWQWVVSAVSSAATAAAGPTNTTNQNSANSQPQAPTQTPAASISLVPQTVWVDRGQGMTVRPRWPGGRSAVALEVQVELDTTPSTPRWEPDGQAAQGPSRALVNTTLSLPMDEWVTVARSGGQRAHSQERGVWHTQNAQSQDLVELQIRVRLP